MQFQRCAELDPNYMFESFYFREGVWTYIGRIHYVMGQFPEARYALERALAIEKNDHLAHLFLGLTLARSGDGPNGLRSIEAGMKGLYGLLEEMTSSQPHSALWDPQREIRSEIERNLALISGRDIDGQKLFSSAEWLGEKFEDEIDLVRRQESRPDE